MGCQPGNTGPITIRPNSDVNVIVDILDTPTNSPHPMEGFEGATGFFQNADSTTLAVSGGVFSSDRGQLNFPLTRVMTKALNQGDNNNAEVWFDQNGVRHIVQFLGQVSVPPSIVSF